MKRHVDALVRAALRDAVGGGGAPIAFQVEPPRYAAFGDLTCDVGIVLARSMGDSPHRLAATVVERLRDDHGWLASVTVDGPGFVNFRFSRAFWCDGLREALAAGPAWGHDPTGSDRRARVAVLGASPGDSRAVRAAVVAGALAQLLGARGWRADAESGAAVDLAIGVLGGGRGEAVPAFRAGLPPGTPLRVLTVSPAHATCDGEPMPWAATPSELPAGARLQMLLGRADRPVDFDLALADRRGTDNPAALLSFARDRLADAVVGAAASGAPDLGPLDETDAEVLRAVAAWPDVLELAALACEPHRIARWAVATATGVHCWVNRHRLLSGGAPPPARIALAGCLEGILSRAMVICGVVGPDGT